MLSYIAHACEADGLKHIVRGFKPNSKQKLKNMDKQLARQALERMRGGTHPQKGATAQTASASASAACACGVGHCRRLVLLYRLPVPAVDIVAHLKGRDRGEGGGIMHTGAN
mmetsp:Transcript_14506/g.37194  ORF Transcript_14506/g.37194 Transcript_14506/m.37194 type:complete len:112 (+) Transcript_14506:152-487(+)